MKYLIDDDYNHDNYNIHSIINEIFEEDKILEKIYLIIESIEKELDKFIDYVNYLWEDIFMEYFNHLESCILTQINHETYSDIFYKYMIVHSKAYKNLLERLEEYRQIEKILILNKKTKIQKLLNKKKKLNI